MKGKFKPDNPKKYKGDPNNIVWRSTWECKYMMGLDANPNILQWSSEEITIPYKNGFDNRVHRYFVDFYIKERLVDGSIKESLIEIKPRHEVVGPKIQNINEMRKPQARRYTKEVIKYKVNEAKWKAAQAYCSDRGWEFKILTEYDLNIRK